MKIKSIIKVKTSPDTSEYSVNWNIPVESSVALRLLNKGKFISIYKDQDTEYEIFIHKKYLKHKLEFIKNAHTPFPYARIFEDDDNMDPAANSELGCVKSGKTILFDTLNIPLFIEMHRQYNTMNR